MAKDTTEAERERVRGELVRACEAGERSLFRDTYDRLLFRMGYSAALSCLGSELAYKEGEMTHKALLGALREAKGKIDGA